MTCRDAVAQDLVLFVREESPDYHARIIRLQGSESAALWEGTATHGVFHAGGRLAYVTGGRRGTDLVAVDLTAEPVTQRRLATLPEDPEALSVSSDGRAALPFRGPSSGTSNPLVIVTVDPTTGDIRDVKVPDDYPSGTVVWAADGRLLFVPDEAGDAVRVYDEKVTVWRGWKSSRALVVDGQLVGLDQGIVRSAPVSGGPVVRFAELGDGLPGALVSVPETSETRLEPGGALAPIRPSQTNTADGSAVTIAVLAAILVAGATVAVYFSSRRRSKTKAT